MLVLLGLGFLVACSGGSGFTDPKKVDKVTVTATPNVVASGGSSSVKAVLAITGSTGTVNTSVDWTLVGGGSLSKNTSNDGEDITFTAPVVSSATNVKLKATSKQDSSKFGEVSIAVAAEIVPTFGISIEPNTINANFEFMKATVTITPINGFTGAVNLSLLNAPNVRISPTTATISGSSPVNVAVELINDISANYTFDALMNLTPQTNATLRAVSSGITRDIGFTYAQKRGVQFGTGATADDYFIGQALSNTGKIAVVGEIETTIPDVVNGKNRRDGGLFVWDANGIQATPVQWAGEDGAGAGFYSVAFATDGSIYVSGRQRRTASNLWQTIIVKYDGNTLQRQWVKSFGGEDNAFNRVHVDSNGNVIIALCFKGVFPSSGLPSGFGNFDIVVAKLNQADGAVIWAKQIGSTGVDCGFDVKTDSSNNVIATAFSEGNLQGPNLGNVDSVIFKFDTNGTELWRKQFGASGTDLGGVNIDGANNVIVTGVLDQGFTSSAYIRKYDSGGTLLWSNTLDTSGQDYFNGAAIDSSNNIYASGATSANIALPNQGGTDIILLKYNSDGAEQWRKQYGSSNSEYAAPLIDSSGNIILQGITCTGANCNPKDGILIKLGR
jgi:hypothetical protein